MTIAIRRAWLQKHPSPVATAGEFHWYPREGDRELRAELVARAQGAEPPAVIWEVAPGRVVWAHAFSAHAPTDGRRYVGLAVAIAEGDAATSELLAALDEPDAAPWTPELAIGDGIDAAGRSSIGAAMLLDDRHTRTVAPQIARGLISGGTTRGAPEDLRASMIALERQLPAMLVRTTRRGIWMLDGPSETGEDRVAELAAGSLAAVSSHTRAWCLLCELAAARNETLDDTWRAAVRPPSAWLTAEELAAWAGGALPASWLATRPQPEQLGLVDMLHLWGRGRFDLCPTAGTVIDRLADAVASRVLAQLADGRDAADAIAEARWYSVLPAARREVLRETLVERVPSLAAGWPTETRERRLEAKDA